MDIDAATNLWVLQATLQVGMKAEYGRLRPLLTDAYLRQVSGQSGLSGQSFEAGTTVRQLLELPINQEADQLKTRETNAARWALAVNQHLSVNWPTEAVRLPQPFAANAARWKAVAPGLWQSQSHSPSSGGRTMVLSLTLRNNATTGLALGEFELIALGTGAGDIRFDCRWPVGERALAQHPSSTVTWVCQAINPPSEGHPAFDQVAQQLSGMTAVQLRLVPSDFDDASSEEQTLLRVMSTGKAQQRLNEFIARNSTCIRWGDCQSRPANGVGSIAGPELRAERAARREAEPVERTTLERLVGIGVIVLSIGIYVPLANRFGNGKVAIGLWLIILAFASMTQSGSMPSLSDGAGLMWPVVWLITWTAVILLPMLPSLLLYALHRRFFGEESKPN